MKDEFQIKFRRTQSVIKKVKGMNLGKIRKIMRIFSKQPSVTPDHLIPEFGITLGEFCVAYVVKT